MPKCAANWYNYESIPMDHSRTSKLIFSLTKLLSNAHLGMQPMCLACIRMLTAKLAGSGRGKSAGPNSLSLHFNSAQAAGCQSICYGFTWAHKTVEKLLSLSEIVTNVLLPTSDMKRHGKILLQNRLYSPCRKAAAFSKSFKRNRGLYFLQNFVGSFLLIFLLKPLISIFISFCA